MKRWLVTLLLALFTRVSFSAPENDATLPWRMDHSPNLPYTPREAVNKMTVPDGFHVEIVASEPDIVNPIAMTFDDRGRIWITESVEYPRLSAGPGRDTIKIIEGVDAAGHSTNVTVFAGGLNIPTGIAVGYGGVWVLNSPDLLFFREKDGKEISREVVLTGFGRTDFHELPSSLTWGPDGWLYGLNGVFNQSQVVSQDGKTHRFTCALWRLHPRTRQFQVFAEGTSNPYGLVWDSQGSAIVEVCHWANDHLFHFVETGYYQRQAGAYPPFTIRIPSITDHGHQKTAYCGIAILDSDAFPDRYHGRVCVGNLHGGCINVDRLERDGATYLAKGEPDLLSANDAWFMPVALKIGPDGCLYILDWYDRYHCSQDAVRDPDGVDRLRGRLYRLRYDKSPRAPVFDLATETDGHLVSRLGSPNIFFRETAQRLLTERLGAAPAPSKSSTRQALQELVFDEKSVRQSRLQALWTLIGGGPLETSFHQRLLQDSDPAFRAWAVRAAGNQGRVAAAVRETVVRLARDVSPDVQLQVAIASRKIAGCDALPLLVDVLAHCGQDKLIPAIVWPNLHPLLETSAARFAALVNSVIANTRPPSSQVLPLNLNRPLSSPIPYGLASLMPNAIERVLSAKNPDIEAAATLLIAATRSMPGRASDCIAVVSAKVDALSAPEAAQLRQRLRPWLDQLLTEPNHPLHLSAQLLAARLHIGTEDAVAVRGTFVSQTEPEAARLQALEALIAFHDRGLPASLPTVLSNAAPPFATRVFAALGRFDDPKLADVILGLYPNLDAGLQSLAIDLLMEREPWALKLLNAVMAGRIPKSALNANYLRKIMDSNDRDAIWAVEKAFGSVREERNPEREKVVANMGVYLRQNIGDPVLGQRVFKNFCAQCHTIYGEGGKVGPDITANGRSSFEQLLSNVFDPSLVIGPGYQVTTVVTKDGRNLTGLIAEDSDQRIVVKMAGEGEEAVLRNNVKYTRASKLSMMPEGIENLLAKKDIADLFAFLSLDAPPSDPKARLIPGAPNVEPRIKIERDDQSLNIRARLPGGQVWLDLGTFVMDPKMRPYLHPLRDASGRVVLTQDRPSDHPWQHGIFTGFHGVNGFNYWKEDQGRQHFVRLLDLKQGPAQVSWRALVNLVAPDGSLVLEEEDDITVHAPESADVYMIDFELLLRAKEQTVNFAKFYVGGLSVRMPWDESNPRQTHFNSNGLRGSACEQKRAAWCNVERPYAGEIYGIALFDHPANQNFPSGWRVDEQGLINPNVSALANWSIPANEERRFRYRLLIYHGAATAEQLAARFDAFARE